MGADGAALFRCFATWSTPDREIGGWVWVRRVKTGATHRVRYKFTREREGIAKSEIGAIFRSRRDKREEQRALRAKRRAARDPSSLCGVGQTRFPKARNAKAPQCGAFA